MDKMNIIAVDVGTASVRLAIVSFQGSDAQEVNIVASHKEDVPYWQDGCKFEQCSTQIWKAICDSSIKCIEKSKIRPDSIKGIAFSATCSLVIQCDDAKDKNKNDIIMWADHRAVAQAQKITDSYSNVLKQFGGVCSPEFSLSKLVWLNENDQERIHSALGFFELPDWLVYRSINENFIDTNNSIPRSSCCVVCKWGYNSDDNHHCDIIASLDSSITTRIGNTVMGPGTISGFMSKKVAEELGIINDKFKEDKENFMSLSSTNIVVATSLIDAHSGMLAMLSVPLNEYCVDIEHCQDIESTFCSLAGTSSCHMLLSKNSNYTRGIWGPYKDVILEGYYLLEAGQSMTGKLVEISLERHEEGKKRLSNGETIIDIINDLNEMIEKKTNYTYEDRLHILPTYHGNRSPLANPRLKGAIYGLSADKEATLLDYYIATIESLVYELKLIVETLETKLNTILVSGGLMKNSFYMQSLADILNCKVVIMSLEDVDFMVMGSALVARHAIINNLQFRDNIQKQVSLNENSVRGIKYDQLNLKVYQPNPAKDLYHKKRYLCYKEFVDLSLKIDKIINFF